MQAINWLIEYEFARQGLMVGIAIGTLCALLSVVVVLKRMAFIGEGVSHAGFGGVGTAIFLGLAGLSQDLVVLGFCLAVALAVGVLSRKRHLEPDSAIGILLVASMAWGVLMSDLRRNFQTSAWYIEWFGRPGPPPRVEELLFGSLLTITPRDLWVTLILCAVILMVCALFFKEILFYCFDEQASKVFGVPAGLVHYLLMFILALTIVLCIRVVGFLLVSALLVIPGATAMLVSRRLGWVMFTAWLVGMGGVVGGILLSLQMGNLSSGACIVAVLCAIFGLTLGWRSLQARLG